MHAELKRLCEKMRAQGVQLPLMERSDVKGEVVAVRDLLEGDLLHRLVDELADRYQAGERVAAASYFHKRYVGLVLAAVLTPMTRAGVGILADPEKMELVLENGEPKGLILSGEPVPLVLTERMQRVYGDVDVSGWMAVKYEDSLRSAVYTSLFDDHLGRLSMRIATEIGLSLRVMWGNIGNYSCWLYDQLCVDGRVKEQAMRDRDSLMTCAGIGSTPLSCSCESVFLEEAQPPQWARVRQTCCLRNKLFGNRCVTCPHLTREERVAALSEYVG